MSSQNSIKIASMYLLKHFTRRIELLKVDQPCVLHKDYFFSHFDKSLSISLIFKVPQRVCIVNALYAPFFPIIFSIDIRQAHKVYFR